MYKRYKINYDKDMYGGTDTINGHLIDILIFIYKNKQYPKETQHRIREHIKKNGMIPLNLIVTKNDKIYKHHITFDTSKNKGTPLYYIVDQQKAAELAAEKLAAERVKLDDQTVQIVNPVKDFEAFYDITEQNAIEMLKGKPNGTFIQTKSSFSVYKLIIMLDNQANKIEKYDLDYDLSTKTFRLITKTSMKSHVNIQYLKEFNGEQITLYVDQKQYIVVLTPYKQDTPVSVIPQKVVPTIPQLDDHTVQIINPIEVDAAKQLLAPIESVNDMIKNKIKTLSNLIIYTLQFPMFFDPNISPYDGNGDRNPAYTKAFYESSILPGSFPGKSSSSIIRIYERRYPHLKYNLDDTKSTIFLLLHTDKDEYKRSIFSKITKDTKIIIVGHCCNTNINGQTIVSDHIQKHNFSRLLLKESDLNTKYIDRDATNFSLILSASLFTRYIQNAGITELGIIELNACNAYLHFKEPLFTSLNSNSISFFGIISNMDPITRLSLITVEDNKDVYDNMNLLGDNSIITMQNNSNYYLKNLFDKDSSYGKMTNFDTYYQTTYNSDRNVECRLQPQMTLTSNQETVYFYLITKCPINNSNELFYYNDSVFIGQCLNYRIVRIKYHGVYFISTIKYTDIMVLNKVIVGSLLFEAFYDDTAIEGKLIGQPNGTFIQRLSSDKTKYILAIVNDTNKNNIIKYKTSYNYSTNTLTVLSPNGQTTPTMVFPLINKDFTINEPGIQNTVTLIPYTQ